MVSPLPPRRRNHAQPIRGGVEIDVPLRIQNVHWRHTIRREQCGHRASLRKMERLSHSDYARLLDFVGGLLEPRTITDFGEGIVRLAAELLPTTPEELHPFPSYRHALMHLLRNLADPRVGAQWRRADLLS